MLHQQADAYCTVRRMSRRRGKPPPLVLPTSICLAVLLVEAPLQAVLVMEAPVQAVLVIEAPVQAVLVSEAPVQAVLVLEAPVQAEVPCAGGACAGPCLRLLMRRPAEVGACPQEVRRRMAEVDACP